MVILLSLEVLGTLEALEFSIQSGTSTLAGLSLEQNTGPDLRYVPPMGCTNFPHLFNGSKKVVTNVRLCYITEATPSL